MDLEEILHEISMEKYKKNNKTKKEKEFYKIQDTKELVDMCLDKDNNIKILQQQNKELQDKLDKIKECFNNKNYQNYYYGDSYEFEIKDFEKDILLIIESEK